MIHHPISLYFTFSQEARARLAELEAATAASPGEAAALPAEVEEPAKTKKRLRRKQGTNQLACEMPARSEGPSEAPTPTPAPATEALESVSEAPKPADLASEPVQEPASKPKEPTNSVQLALPCPSHLAKPAVNVIRVPSSMPLRHYDSDVEDAQNPWDHEQEQPQSTSSVVLALCGSPFKQAPCPAPAPVPVPEEPMTPPRPRNLEPSFAQAEGALVLAIKGPEANVNEDDDSLPSPSILKDYFALRASDADDSNDALAKETWLPCCICSIA